MATALVPVLTRVGLDALRRAQGDGLRAELSHLAVGRGVNAAGTFVGYNPTRAATGLVNETARVPILEGELIDPSGFRVLGRVPAKSTPNDYYINEVGFFLSNGVLLALWSDPAGPIAGKTRFADVDLALELILDQIPAGTLVLTVGPPVVPDLAAAVANLLAGQARQFIASIDVEQRLSAGKL